MCSISNSVTGVVVLDNVFPLGKQWFSGFIEFQQHLLFPVSV